MKSQGRLNWFRFYDEVVDDPKVQRLSPSLFRTWINFLCIASKNTAKRGTLPDIEDVAYRLRVTRLRAEALLNDLIEAGLFEWIDGVAHSHNWNGRQFQSDVSTERVKRFRNAQRNVSETANETDQSRAEQSTPVVPKGTEQVLYSSDFEVFWKAYPRHEGKGAAFKAWKKLSPSQTLQEIILTAISLQSKSPQWLKDRGQFIPQPATWLNQCRWDDEITQPPPLQSRSAVAL